jgi:hypothetical protein
VSIVVLGWGSLIWKPGKLPLRSDWTRNGPTLPIEFSRISGDGRLTLVIDEYNGAPVPTRFAESSQLNLQDAINDLWLREGKPLRTDIGYVDRKSGIVNTRSGITGETIRAWAAERDLNAVIWTNLPSNFTDTVGREFSPEAAAKYLQDLSSSSLKRFERAVEYIQKAPSEVDTPTRQHLAAVGLV